MIFSEVGASDSGRPLPGTVNLGQDLGIHSVEQSGNVPPYGYTAGHGNQSQPGSPGSNLGLYSIAPGYGIEPYHGYGPYDGRGGAHQRVTASTPIDGAQLGQDDSAVAEVLRQFVEVEKGQARSLRTIAIWTALMGGLTVAGIAASIALVVFAPKRERV